MTSVGPNLDIFCVDIHVELIPPPPGPVRRGSGGAS